VVAPSGKSFSFALDAGRKEKLLQGLDDIGLTLKREAEIAAFEEARRSNAPGRT
jgi:3-isopropylmalate/(R)-2-methylmalate dehydratase small subunit